MLGWRGDAMVAGQSSAPPGRSQTPSQGPCPKPSSGTSVGPLQGATPWPNRRPEGRFRRFRAESKPVPSCVAPHSRNSQKEKRDAPDEPNLVAEPVEPQDP